jgi:hypothetical protein
MSPRQLTFPKSVFNVDVPGPTASQGGELLGGSGVISAVQIVARPLEPQAIEPALDPKIAGVPQDRGQD